jgi:hypothetical protein
MNKKCHSSSLGGALKTKKTFSSLFFMKSKLGNKLNEHLPIVVGMFSQPFFILEFFSYDIVFHKWKKVKVRKLCE